jgi:hypothetical protein
MENRVGEKYMTNEGYEVEIIEYRNYKQCIVLLDNNLVIKNRWYSDIKKGKIKNPYHKSVNGIGYFGVGIYSSNKNSLTYTTWKAILQRGYDKKYHINYPTYTGCSVAEEWHNFQNFAQWFEDNYNPETMIGWHLDKDILVRGNKIYSPETCCFVPHDINSLFRNNKKVTNNLAVGVHKSFDNFTAYIHKNNTATYIGTYRTIEEAFQAYKAEKEKYIKEVADKWKDKIDPKVYEAMYKYEVEMTD